MDPVLSRGHLVAVWPKAIAWMRGWMSIDASCPTMKYTEDQPIRAVGDDFDDARVVGHRPPVGDIRELLRTL